MGQAARGRTRDPASSPDVPLQPARAAGTNRRVIKDPADLIEKPLHLLGLHHYTAMAAAAAIALVVATVVLVWRRRVAAV